jgi:hypothetical protein
MRCEDCLPLIEEYYDGEVTSQTAEQVRAHLSACADCAAALDALSFEQEIYARYDRGGLEVTPDLWARVSAEIARTPPAEVPVARRPFLSRAREYAAVALGTLALRPALASALALLLVAAAAGTLWLARRQRPNVPAQEIVRQNIPTLPAAIIPQASEDGDPDAAPTGMGSLIVDDGGTLTAAENAPRDNSREVAGGYRTITIAPGVVAGEDEIEKLLVTPSAPSANPNVVVIKDDDHDDTAGLFVNVSAPGRESAAATDARMLDPGQKDVARHVERAQMLLRSIKNVRASEMGDADITYEKNLSRQLLAENSTLQLEAEVKGDKESKQVLDRIEPFLLEIANMGEKPSREEVRSIRERVRQNEIVAALEVY